MTDEDRVSVIRNFKKFMDDNGRLPNSKEVEQFGFCYSTVIKLGRLQTIANRIKNGYYDNFFNL